MAVYFIRNTRSGSIKIGVSDSPPQRLSELHTGNEDELLIELIIPGDRSVEKHLHAMWQSSSLRGEWFAESEELRLFISHAQTLKAVSEYGQPAVNTLLWFTERADIGKRWTAAWLGSLGIPITRVNEL